MVKNTKVQKRISLTVYHALMLLFSLLMIYPLLWMLASSIKPNGEIFTKASSLLTDSPSFEHYTTGWRGFGGYTFGRFFSNSLLVALISALGMMLSSAVVAYGFARIKFKGRQFWFTAMIVTMMLPGQVMMIPRFVLFNEMGWVGTFLPMTVPAFFGSGFNIFLIMQFIRTIPYELDEAASIDGCSRYSSFLRIYALKMFNDSSQADYGATFAMSVLSLIPILIIFFFFQKQLVEGISTQGLKG